MLKIDIHTHILPPNIPRFREKFGYGGFIELQHTSNCCANMMRDDGTFFRAVESNCWDENVRLAECESHGIHVQVLSTVPVMFSYWAQPQHGLEVSRFLNDHIAQVVARSPKRFVGLGTVPMQDVTLAIQELERAVRELRFPGVQIGSNINGANLDDERFFPFYEAAQDLGAALFVHPWEMLGTQRMPRYWMPWLVGMPAETALAICSFIFGGVFDAFPRLRVAFAHGGGSFPATLGRIAHGFEARPDLCAVKVTKSPREYLKHFFVDSLVHDARALRYLIDVMGSNHIALGSDYPFPLGELCPGKLIESINLSPDERENLFYATALRWLQRDHNSFV